MSYSAQLNTMAYDGGRLQTYGVSGRIIIPNILKLDQVGLPDVFE